MLKHTIDVARELRDVFGSFVTGVTVVTTVDAHGVSQGVTANSFTSVSLDPPLVLWSQAKSARSFPAFRDADRFIVNILSEHQHELAQRFAMPGPGKFNGIVTHLRDSGIPALPECCAYVECRKVAMYPGGDHILHLGEVVAMERNERRPLAFAKGKYMVAFEHEMNFALPGISQDCSVHNAAVRLACTVLPELASRLDAAMGIAVWGNRGPTLVRWEFGRSFEMLDLRAGTVVSPLASAIGLVFGAYLPGQVYDRVVKEALAELQAGGDDVLGAREMYRQRLQEVRASGVGMVRLGSMPQMLEISAPVFDRAGQVVLAVCCVAPDREPGARHLLSSDLKHSAAGLSKRLGHAIGRPSGLPA